MDQSPLGDRRIYAGHDRPERGNFNFVAVFPTAPGWVQASRGCLDNRQLE